MEIDKEVYDKLQKDSGGKILQALKESKNQSKDASNFKSVSELVSYQKKNL